MFCLTTWIECVLLRDSTRLKHPQALDRFVQVWIQSHTLCIFNRSSTSPTEGFFYPSALSFLWRDCLSPRGDNCFVLQYPVFRSSELILSRFSSYKPSSLLLRPGNIFNPKWKFLFIKWFFFTFIQAVKACLKPTEIVAPHTTQMTEALLNIVLENNSRSFLASCIKDEGTNLNFVEIGRGIK
jgi:hypothetical protein